MSKKKQYFKRKVNKKVSSKKQVQKPAKKISLPTFGIKGSYIIIFFVALNFLLIFLIFELTEKISENQIFTFAYYSKKNIFPIFDKKFDLNVSALSYVVYDPDLRVVVAGKNEHLRFAPASTVKIMSALVALEHYSLDRILKVSNVGTVEGSHMGLIEGEEITVEDLLYGLLLPSGNDAAYVLARNYIEGYASFIDSMNKKALELKLYNTNFVDPAGYEDSNYTTAFDLARLASHSLKNQEFQKIVGTKSKKVTGQTPKITHNLENLNKLLDGKQILGIKTGFTEEAGGVLVTSFVDNDKTYILVVLKSLDRFEDTKDLISKIVKNIRLISY